MPEATKRFGPNVGLVAVGLEMFGFKLRSRLFHGVRTSWVIRASDGDVLEKIASLVDEGKLKPVLYREFSLDEIAAAHEYSQTGRARGKIVVRVKPGAMTASEEGLS